MKNIVILKDLLLLMEFLLTIAKILKNGFQISIIPQTLKLTNLINLKKMIL